MDNLRLNKGEFRDSVRGVSNPGPGCNNSRVLMSAI
jgi:hypothetical protein